MAKLLDGKKALKLLLFGSGVVIITPFLSGFIPSIIDLKVITLGTALSAGIAAFLTDLLLNQFMK